MADDKRMLLFVGVMCALIAGLALGRLSEMVGD